MFHIRGTLVNAYEGFFAKEVVKSISLSRMLDSYLASASIDKIIPIPPFVTTHLELRILNVSKGRLPRLLYLRHICESLSRQDANGRDMQHYVKLLCPWVVSNLGPLIFRLWESSTTRGPMESFEEDLYVAAICTQTMPIVAQWTARGNTAKASRWYFGNTLHSATQYGDHETIATMITNESIDVMQTGRLQALGWVAEAGRVAATRFVFNFGTEQCPWEFSKERRPSLYAYFNERDFAIPYTPSREISDFLMEKRRLYCVSKKFSPRQFTRLLGGCARNGWEAMTAHYIDLGASVDGMVSRDCLTDTVGDEDEPIIVCACRRGHEGVVKLLLGRGASTAAPALEVAVQYLQDTIVRLILHNGAEFGNTVSKAVEKGYGRILKELFENGATIGNDSRPLLISAVGQEDVAIFWLLLEQGADLTDRKTVLDCMKEAEENGLDSMLKLLSEAGANLP